MRWTLPRALRKKKKGVPVEVRSLVNLPVEVRSLVYSFLFDPSLPADGAAWRAIASARLSEKEAAATLRTALTTVQRLHLGVEALFSNDEERLRQCHAAVVSFPFASSTRRSDAVPRVVLRSVREDMRSHVHTWVRSLSFRSYRLFLTSEECDRACFSFMLDCIRSRAYGVVAKGVKVPLRPEGVEAVRKAWYRFLCDELCRFRREELVAVRSILGEEQSEVLLWTAAAL